MCPKNIDASALTSANLASWQGLHNFIEVPKAWASLYCGHIFFFFVVVVVVYFTCFKMGL